MFEIELKFEVPADRRDALLAALRRGKVVEQRLQARYFDTADEQLATHRIALRLRKEGPQWVQTLKAATADSMRRHEHNCPVTGARRGEPPTLNPALHDGTPAGEALTKALAAGHLQPDALQARYETDVRRTSREIRFEGSRIEVALDTGSIIAGEQRVAICEVEFELKAGPVSGLVSLAERWVGPHGLWLNTVSKAERGTRLARGERYGPSVKAGTRDIAKDSAKDIAKDGAKDSAQGDTQSRRPHPMTPPSVLRTVVANCLDQVTGNASEVAAGSLDGDHVHQLRVGIRRMRTALREMSAFDTGIDLQWEPALQKAFAELGSFRDRETVIAQIEPQLRAAGAPARFKSFTSFEGASTSGPSPQQSVLAASFQLTLLQLLRFSLTPPGTGDDTHSASAARSLFVDRLKRLHRRVLHDGARFTSLDTAAQHSVRKRLKRLRYLAEFATPLFGRKKTQRYLRALRPAQEQLGQHNDQVVALASYKRDASTDPHAAFAAGWLTARQADSASACQKALARVARAEKFWTRHD